MLRARFKSNSKDYRPVTFPPPHPWWCTGYDANGIAIIVAYADDEDQIRSLWPEATNIDSEPVDGYSFTSRFPKPTWM